MCFRIIATAILAVLLPISASFAQSATIPCPQDGSAPCYEGLYDDAYGSEYDSIYDSGDPSQNSADAAPEQSDQNEPSVEISPSGIPIIRRVSPKTEGSASENKFVERDKKAKRKRRPKYFLYLGAAGDFHFDSYIGNSGAHTNIFGGVTGSIRFGSLGNDLQWAVEQIFGHMWGLRIDGGSKDLTRYDAATFLEMNVFYRVRRDLDLLYTLGTGVLYNIPHDGEPATNADRFSIDEHGTNLAVGFKLGVSIINSFNAYFGIGADLSFLFGVDLGTYIKSQAKTTGDEDAGKLMNEILQPGVFCFIKF